jgi:hypothetical protein
LNDGKCDKVEREEQPRRRRPACARIHGCMRSFVIIGVCLCACVRACVRA